MRDGVLMRRTAGLDGPIALLADSMIPRALEGTSYNQSVKTKYRSLKIK